MKKVCQLHRRYPCNACKSNSLFRDNPESSYWMEVSDSSISHSSEGNYVSYDGNSGISDSGSSSSSSSYDSGSGSSGSSSDSGSSW